ncbi:ATP-binding protein [Granulosicoccus sp. 3-233]|uniref:sensor histidine kinase n=1 Tax=Granulosicoccus sp. 3-233 TaxID=3417969 RepID=UPI003D3382B9
MLAILFTSLVLTNKVDNRLLQLWVFASCSVIVVRVILLRAVTRHADLSEAGKRVVATLLTLVLGCTIGSVLYFYPHVGTFERAMLTAILLGLCTISHSTNFGYRPILLSYIGPLLGTLGILWIANIDQLMHPALAVAVGVSVLIVGLTMLLNGKFMFDVFALSIESSIKLEEQSRHLSDALQLAEQAKSEAEASSQSKTRFIAAASHDLRQPVHVLNMLGAAIAREKMSPRASDIVENMNIAVTSLSSQLNALLDISELDSGSVKPVIRSVNLSALADKLKLEMQQLAADKRIELICDLPSDLYVRTDAAMLSQIIRNLCGNAIKYTFTGHVRIQASASPSTVTLSISDTGIGIDDADCDKVFEEFYQVSNPGRDKGRGMGLGLSIVERLIRNLGHTIKLTSRVGKGTDVTICLKRCTQSQVAAAVAAESPSSPDITLQPGIWVHLVEDEEAVQRSVEMFLQSVGCKVTITASSSSTLEFLVQQTPDVMLIDLRLQNHDSGLKVVDWVNEHRPDLPIAIVTGESLAEGEVAREYPDVLLLQKPVNNHDLLELLDYLVNSEQTPDRELGSTVTEHQ